MKVWLSLLQTIVQQTRLGSWEPWLPQKVAPTCVRLRRFHSATMSRTAACRHSIGSSHDFDFIAYLRDSLEDDYAQLVGLSVPVWLIIVLSLLLSWALGAPTPALQLGLQALPHSQACFQGLSAVHRMLPLLCSL